MRKISTCFLALLLTVSFTACSSVQFSGSRTGNESQLIMDYKVLNTTDTQALELSAGDIVNFEIVSQSGSVDVRLQKEGEDPIYEGTDIPTSMFQVTIDDGGTYIASVTGRRAKGSVSITTSSPDPETPPSADTEGK